MLTLHYSHLCLSQKFQWNLPPRMKNDNILQQAKKNERCISHQEIINSFHIWHAGNLFIRGGHNQHSRQEACHADSHSGRIGRSWDPKVHPSHHDKERTRNVDVPHIVALQPCKVEANSQLGESTWKGKILLWKRCLLQIKMVLVGKIYFKEMVKNLPGGSALGVY